MKKLNNIVYWIATIWLSLGMVSTGVVQILQMEEEIKFITDMGYPLYFLTFLGVCKILGVSAVLIPKFPLLKEWAYAGFFFMMAGAVFSHFASGNAISEVLPAFLLLALTIVSWYFRPVQRRLSAVV